MDRVYVEVKCDPKCDGCYGSTNSECENCVKNARLIKDK